MAGENYRRTIAGANLYSDNKVFLQEIRKAFASEDCKTTTTCESEYDLSKHVCECHDGYITRTINYNENGSRIEEYDIELLNGEYDFNFSYNDSIRNDDAFQIAIKSNNTDKLITFTNNGGGFFSSFATAYMLDLSGKNKSEQKQILQIISNVWSSLESFFEAKLPLSVDTNNCFVSCCSSENINQSADLYIFGH